MIKDSVLSHVLEGRLKDSLQGGLGRPLLSSAVRGKYAFSYKVITLESTLQALEFAVRKMLELLGPERHWKVETLQDEEKVCFCLRIGD